MIGRNKVDGTVGERRPQRRLVASFPNRRIHPDDAGKAGVVVSREHQIVRAGLARDVDPARLGLAQRPQLLGRRDMENVNARAGPFRENGGAAYRLHGHYRRARGDMGERIDAARVAHAGLAPLHDRVGLGMERDALAGAGNDFESLEHRAGRRARDLAEGVAHVELEADDAAVDQNRHMRDGVLAEEAVEAEVHMRVPGCDVVLRRQHLGRAGRRDGVGHVEHRGDATEGRRRGAALEIFLVGIAGIAEMHMHVDGAGKDMQPARVELLARRRHRRGSAHRQDRAVLDCDVGIDDAVGRHDLAAANDEIGRGHFCFLPCGSWLLTASPSRRRPAGRHR